ncbi:helicase domain protein [Mycobacterium kansasii]|uniref:Helicase domain protein n=1 Tax=Mycobacterium kansasii TaxID=1768 RepID=A0A1V3WDW3_MYCKA|nr:helicase domain protein [Mycobacterium kansasii]
MLTFGELKAAAAGNDLLLRQHELESRVRALRLAHVTVAQNVRTLLHQAAAAETAAEAARARVKRLEAFAEHRNGMGEIDLARVAADACRQRDPKDYRFGLRARWGDGRVSVRTVDTDPGRRLELSFDHRVLWAEPLPGKVRRRGAAAVQAWAEAMVAAWVAAVDREVEQTRGRVDAALRQAQDARTAAAATDVGEPADLVAARAELAEVNEAIDNALNEESRPAAA